MGNIIEQHLEAALEHYSQDNYYNVMLEAKKLYLELTGAVDDSDADYENKMNCFNDWYLLQYSLPEKKCTVMEDYLKSQSPEEELTEAFKSFCHSAFQYRGKSFRGHLTIKDLWSKKKIILNKDTPMTLLKNDFFIGRIIPWQQEAHLMKGHSLLPPESWPLIKKQMRLLKKAQKNSDKNNFLFKLEYLNTKYRHYDHVDAAKIFIFD